MILTDSYTRIAVMTLERPGVDVGGPVLPPVDEGDEGGDDEEGWEWQALDSKYRVRMREWVSSSPAARQIMRVVFESVFSQEPQVKWDDPRRAQEPYTGFMVMNVFWAYHGNVYDNFEEEFVVILKRSDLFKVFRIEPAQLWGVLDKGDVYEWTINFILKEMSRRFEDDNGEVRSIGGNQVEFHIYDLISREKAKFEKYINDLITYKVGWGQQPREVQLEFLKLSVRAALPFDSSIKVFDDGIKASGRVRWFYQPE